MDFNLTIATIGKLIDNTIDDKALIKRYNKIRKSIGKETKKRDLNELQLTKEELKKDEDLMDLLADYFSGDPKAFYSYNNKKISEMLLDTGDRRETENKVMVEVLNNRIEEQKKISNPKKEKDIAIYHTWKVNEVKKQPAKNIALFINARLDNAAKGPEKDETAVLMELCMEFQLHWVMIAFKTLEDGTGYLSYIKQELFIPDSLILSSLTQTADGAKMIIGGDFRRYDLIWTSYLDILFKKEYQDGHNITKAIFTV